MNCKNSCCLPRSRGKSSQATCFRLDVAQARKEKCKKYSKTYNTGDLLVVTYLITSPQVHCLYIAKRAGSLAFTYATVTTSVNLSVCSIPLFRLQEAPFMYETINTHSSVGGLLCALGLKRH